VGCPLPYFDSRHVWQFDPCVVSWAANFGSFGRLIERFHSKPYIIYHLISLQWVFFGIPKKFPGHMKLPKILRLVVGASLSSRPCVVPKIVPALPLGATPEAQLQTPMQAQPCRRGQGVPILSTYTYAYMIIYVMYMKLCCIWMLHGALLPWVLDTDLSIWMCSSVDHIHIQTYPNISIHISRW